MPLLDIRNQFAEFRQGIRVDDRHVDPSEIEQRLDIFSGSAGDDRQYVHVLAIVHGAGNSVAKRIGAPSSRPPARPTVQAFKASTAVASSGRNGALVAD